MAPLAIAPPLPHSAHVCCSPSTAARFVLAMMGIATGSVVWAADDVPLDQWYYFQVFNAATAQPSVVGSNIELVPSNAPNTSLLAYFDPIPFAAGKPVTLSCRMHIPDDTTNSTQQYRLGLYGVVAGTPSSTKKQEQLRGFVLSAGNAKDKWDVTFYEHDRKEGGLIYAAGLTEIARVSAEKTGGRGADARVVLTLAKQPDGTVNASGFWGDMPFAFACTPKAGDYTHLCAVAVMRGRNTGQQKMTVGNVRVRRD